MYPKFVFDCDYNYCFSVQIWLRNHGWYAQILEKGEDVEQCMKLFKELRGSEKKLQKEERKAEREREREREGEGERESED